MATSRNTLGAILSSVSSLANVTTSSIGLAAEHIDRYAGNKAIRDAENATQNAIRIKEAKQQLTDNGITAESFKADMLALKEINEALNEGLKTFSTKNN